MSSFSAFLAVEGKDASFSFQPDIFYDLEL